MGGPMAGGVQGLACGEAQAVGRAGGPLSLRVRLHFHCKAQGKPSAMRSYCQASRNLRVLERCWTYDRLRVPLVVAHRPSHERHSSLHHRTTLIDRLTPA